MPILLFTISTLQRTDEKLYPTAIAHTCTYKHACPYLGYADVIHIKKELSELKQRDKHRVLLMQRATEEIERLREENTLLKEQYDILKRKYTLLHQSQFKPNADPDTQDTGTDAEAGGNETPKPATKKKRGAPRGHRGATRKKPSHADEYVNVPAHRCPTCNGTHLAECKTVRDHFQEDIILAVTTKTTCFQHPYYYCRDCQQVFTSGPGKGELPRGYVGPVAKAVSAHLHHTIGISSGHVVQIFSDLFGFDITKTSLCGFEDYLTEKSLPWYENILEKIRLQDHLHLDETIWRIDGANAWLWCFTNENIVFYHIDETRKKEVVKAILGDSFDGTLCMDFYAAYDEITAQAKQRCLVHLLRELKKIAQWFPENAEVSAFVRAVKTLIRDAVNLRKDFLLHILSEKKYAEGKEKLQNRLDEIIASSYANKECERIRKRLEKYQDELFTFLDYLHISPDNNHAERQIRPSVLMKHTCFGSRSFRGAQNHAVIMTLAQTAQLNNQNPKDALLALITQNTEKIPSLLFGAPHSDDKNDVPQSSLSASLPQQPDPVLCTGIPP
jgi:hypothetical protein